MKMKHCRFGHKWGQWVGGIATVTTHERSGTSTRDVMGQSRNCQRCNLRQVRTD